MATYNLAQSSSSMTPSSRVRSLWQSFEKTLTTGRTTMEHKVQAAKAKADTEYNKTPSHLRMPQSAHDATKAKLVKKIKETYFEGVRGQWQARLLKAGLRDDHWTDITPSEMERISHLLGSEDESDEDMVVVAAPKTVPMIQPQHFYTPNFLQPLAPSISTSTRASNASSASSYAVVNPNEFHSEEEDYFFSSRMASCSLLDIVTRAHPQTHTQTSSHELTSDDDEGADPPGTTGGQPARRRVDPFGTWSSSESLGSSLQKSAHSATENPATRPLASDFAYNKRTSSAKQAAGLQNQKESVASSSKSDVRSPYIGPCLDDADDSLSDEEDFERFKMQTRMQKIAEFHKAAALAEIHLSLKIYRFRKSQPAEKHLVSSLLSDHHKNMAQLQTVKEEERKTVVKDERSKRRSDLRKRPGRSNTILAPTPSAPANPSWLNALEDEAPAEIQTTFDLDQLLSEDPHEQAINVEQFLQQMFPDTAPPPPSFGNPLSAQRSNSASFQAAAYGVTSQYNPTNQWSSSSSSMQQNAVAGSSAQGSHSHIHKRRQSDARNKPPFRASSSRPSPFGEDESSDEEEDNSPPENANPLMNPNTAALLTSQLQEDPDIAQAFAHYTGMTEGKNSPPSFPSWGSRLASQPPSAPTASASSAKDVRATPLASGWNRRKAGAATPQPTQASSFKNPFGVADDSEPASTFAPNPLAASSTFLNAKGKRAVVAPEEPGPFWAKQSMAASEDQQPIWGKKTTISSEDQQPTWANKKSMAASEDEEPSWSKKYMMASEDQPPAWGKKPTPPTEEQQSFWGTKPIAAAPEEQQPVWGEPPKKSPPAAAATKPAVAAKAPPVPAKVEKPAPPPAAPAAAPKKQSKKQRQNNKKGGGGAATVEEPEPEPAAYPVAPEVSESVAELDSPALEESAYDTPESMFSTMASMARMVPGIGRKRMDSVGASTFSGWESEAASTPRPPPKIPAHLQESMSFKSDGAPGTPRPSLLKKHQLSDSMMSMSASSPLSQGTIKANQWGSAAAASTPPTRSLWNMFTGDAAPAKTAREAAEVSSSEREPWLPGGFGANADGGGGKEDLNGGGGGGGEDDDDDANEDGMADTQQFWKPAAAKKPTPAPAPAPPPPLSAAQRLRRGSEPVVAAPSPAPRAVPTKATASATQPQPIPAAANSKKGRAKKNAKGKKATIEEVQDEDEVTRGESLPVDSKTILEDSNPILEPKPSLAPALFDSIISYTDEEDEEAAFSSYAPTPSTAASSPPDLFGGDEARIAAAVKELREGTAKMGKIHGGGASAWGASSAKRSPWGSSEVEPESQNSPFASFGARSTPAPKSSAPQTPAWGQMSGKDKGKSKMSDSNEGEQSTKAANPTIQNLKRSKAAGGKLF